MIAELAAQVPGLQMWFTLVLTALVVVFYVTEWTSLEVTSLALLSVLLIVFTLAPVPLLGGGGMLGPERLLSGFSNPALITVLALLVVGEGLIRTGALDSVAALAAHPGLGRWLGVVLLLFGVAILSAFLNNTPVVVIFIPILQTLARKLDVPGSKVMMLLSFAAILGGTTTLIGSSTNLLVSNALVQLGEDRLGFFEFTPLALCLGAAGFVYLVLIAPRLLPGRESLAGVVTRHGQQFISQIQVPEDSALVGQKAKAGHFKDLPDVTVRMIQRGEHAELPPFDDVAVQPGDVLIIAAPRTALAEVAARHPGHLHPPSRLGTDTVAERLAHHERGRVPMGGETNGGEGDATMRRRRKAEQMLVEAMVTPSSRLVGQSLEQYGFRQRYHCVVVGILRRAHMVRQRMTKIRLEAGDVLLVAGRQQDIDALAPDRDVVVVSGTSDTVPQRDKAGSAAGIFAVAVALAAAGIVPIVVSAVTAAMLMIAMGAVNLRQASRALDRKVVLVVAATLALGEALYHTGGAAYVAHGVVSAIGGLGPTGIVSVFFLVVALFTNILSNNACAVLFTPVGIGLAEQIGLDPRIFAITVLLAANCSFASPVGYQTNLLVMGPGQYAFADFVKVGLPMVVVLWVVFSFVAPMFFGI